MTKRTIPILCAVFGLAVGLAPVQAQPQAPADAAAPVDWAGVWVAEKRFGPDLAGPVSLSRTGRGWEAIVQGDTVPVDRREAADGSVEWAFDFFGQGRFVGRQASAGSPIRGHWIQPPGVVQNYPYATPVRLEAFAGGNGYHGMIKPFSQEASLNRLNRELGLHLQARALPVHCSRTARSGWL
jgi:hypothetical protein